MAPVEEDRRKFCPFVARFLLMHCQTGGVDCSMCAVLHLKKKYIKKKKSPRCFITHPTTMLPQPALHLPHPTQLPRSPAAPALSQRRGQLQLSVECLLLPEIASSTTSQITVRGRDGEAVCRYCQAQLDRYCQNCQSVVTINILAG